VKNQTLKGPFSTREDCGQERTITRRERGNVTMGWGGWGNKREAIKTRMEQRRNETYDLLRHGEGSIEKIGTGEKKKPPTACSWKKGVSQCLSKPGKEGIGLSPQGRRSANK